MTIRHNLRQARQAAGISQESLAHAVGTTHQTYASVELGKQSIKLDLALRVAEQLGYDCSPLRELFALEGDR
jgi:DNA-binding XRE family transcriptional regulator